MEIDSNPITKPSKKRTILRGGDVRKHLCERIGVV